MKKLVIALAAASVALGATAASAQPRGDRDRGDRDRDGVPNAFDRHDNRGGGHHWARGQRLDSRFHSRDYVVSDWRSRGWRPPPRGYAYYRTDTGDVVLAAVATGVITSVLANALSH